MKSKEIKLRIIEAGERAVEQLIKVAKEDIIKHDPEDDISADRLKNAAATKKLAIFDAFEILNRIEAEKEAIESLEKGTNKTNTIGVIVPQINDPFFGEIIRGISEVSTEYDLNIILCNTEDNIDKELKFLEVLQKQRIQGIIITPTLAKSDRNKNFLKSHLQC